MREIRTGGSLAALRLMLVRYRNIYVVYDSNLKEAALKIASSRPALPLHSGEIHKTMDSVLGICRWLLYQDAGRDSVLVAVGGGVILDIAGFAAGIYKRGIRYVNVPTTLLAMVDAGVGGKTGVNLEDFKNMIGLVHRPEFTYICPAFLRTLPGREIRSGSAEMLKTFIINNKNDAYFKAVSLLSTDFALDALTPLIKQAAKTKLRIVRRDENDRGPRRVLNLGHTYAHAIEWWQNQSRNQNQGRDTFSHGEAVAIGIIQAAKMSEEKGIAPAGLAETLRDDFVRCSLPVDLPCPADELEPAISQDKKISGGKLNFVYIKRIGSVKIEKI